MKSFEEMGLSPEILRAVSELGYESPTPIQDKSIDLLMHSTQDLIGLAQTGTGKTAAFSLPILHQSDVNNKQIQTLVLCPTRELCLQISNDVKSYSKYLKDFEVIPVYGGANIDTQIRALKKGGQMVVGTPGRTLDLIKRRVLNVRNIQWLVLDEADEMLTMGFKDDLDAILATTPKGKQILLYSATMPKEIVSIAEKYMNQPEEISVGKRNSGADNIEHAYYMVHSRDRYEALKRLADLYPDIYAIVFCRTRHETKEVASKLAHDGYNADALHGDLSQAQRDHVMQRFRDKQLQLLVATDVAARGLDVNNLSHVIHYNLPDDLEIYIHRSGRTGRAGKNGTSLSIVHTRETGKIRLLEKRVAKEIKQRKVPVGKEICEKQLFHFIDKMEKVEINHSQIEPFLEAVYKKLEWLSREELIKHFVSVEFNRFLAYYQDAEDINASKKENEKEGSKGERRRGKSSFSRFYIDIGSKDKVTPKLLIGLLNESMPGKKFEIGQIEILKGFSFFEVESSLENEVIKSLLHKPYKGKKLMVEISKGKKGGQKREPRYRRKRV